MYFNYLNMKDCRRVHLSEVCEIVSGTTPKTSVPEYWEGSLKWITPAELKEDGMFINDTNRHISKEAVEDSHLKLLPKGTVLFSSRAPIGKVAIADDSMYCNQGFKNMICNDEIDSKYLYFFLKYNSEKIKFMGRGATFKEISKSQMEGLEICLPSLTVQNQVTTGLMKIDELVGGKKKQLTLLEMMTRSRFKMEGLEICLPSLTVQNQVTTGLMKIDELVGGKKKQLTLLEMMTRSRFNELVAGTNIIVPAEDLCSDIVDCPHSTPKYTGIDLKYPSIRTTDINNGQINWTTMKYVDHREYLERTRRLVPQPGDIVYSREGSYGDCVIIPENIEMCLGQRTMLFRPNRKKVTSEYMEVALQSEDVKKQADKNNTGSTVPHVNVKDAKRFLIPLVDLESQEDFSGFVNQVNKSKLAIQKSIDELETLKKKLMQEYFG